MLIITFYLLFIVFLQLPLGLFLFDFICYRFFLFLTYYFILLLNVVLPLMVKIPKILYAKQLIHYQYLQFFYSGILLNLFLKCLILLLLQLKLESHENLILLFICISISSIINIYKYIIEIIGHIILYFNEYWHNTLSFGYMYDYPNGFHESEIPGATPRLRDRFYFFKPILQFFILIRYLIIREPMLYIGIHLLIVLDFLFDKNPIYTYIYLIIINLSRFIFFLAEERFNQKDYFRHWQVALHSLYGNFPPSRRVLNLQYVNTNKKIFSLTKNNLDFAYFFCSRYYMDTVDYMYLRQVKFKLLPKWALIHGAIQNAHGYGLSLLEKYWYLYPKLVNDTQKFVPTNQCFWLGFFLLVIYFF